jgi:hypothetical protein
MRRVEMVYKEQYHPRILEWCTHVIMKSKKDNIEEFQLLIDSYEQYM